MSLIQSQRASLIFTVEFTAPFPFFIEQKYLNNAIAFGRAGPEFPLKLKNTDKDIKSGDLWGTQFRAQVIAWTYRSKSDKCMPHM